jgi:hypothetical protein
MIELFSKLEAEKDKWIHQAIDVFSEGFLRFDEQKYDKDQVLMGDYGPTLNAVDTAENQILQIKNMLHSIRRQKIQELDGMKKIIQQLSETIENDEKSCKNDEKALDDLRAKLTSITDNLNRLDKLRMEEFDYEMEEHFRFEKGKVIFKDRKTDKLIDMYNSLELAMLQHYEKQMRDLVKTMENVMLNVDLNPSLDFEATPFISGLELKHGGLSNQYLLYKNFEEDFSIVEETLEDNHKTIHQYYQQQINHMVKQCKQSLMDLLESKQNHHRAAEEEVEQKKQIIHMNKNELKDVKGKLDHLSRKWNQELEYPLQLDAILKEEFVKAVSELQTKVVSLEASDSEKWVYHQYSQIMLKQAERIIGNDYI